MRHDESIPMLYQSHYKMIGEGVEPELHEGCKKFFLIFLLFYKNGNGYQAFTEQVLLNQNTV